MSMIGIGNGASRTSAGPWHQHWSALLGTFVRDGVVVATLWAVALYTEWPWLLALALVGFTPSLLAWVRWRCRRVCLTPVELIIQSGIVTAQTVRFPIREIDVFEARQSLGGRLFDYGDVAVRSGPNVQAFQRLHPFTGFMAAYQACRRVPAGWPEPGRRWLPAPPIGQLPGPRPQEPWREEDRIVNGQVRRLESWAPGTGGGPSVWRALLPLIALYLALSIVIALIMGV